MSDESWKDQALCKGRRDVRWFAPTGPPPTTRKDGNRLRPSTATREVQDGRVPHWTTEGRRICVQCPVRPECLEFAQENLLIGLFAGTTDLERSRLRSYERGTVKKPPPCPECDRAWTVHTDTTKRYVVCLDCLHRWRIR